MSEKDLFKPCESSGVRYASNICWILRDYLQNGIPRRNSKGIYSSSPVRISTGEHLGEKVCYHSGKDDPIILNVCPFCGGKLHSVKDEE
ncbi:hypothetical protein [Mixta gaviniae]|uniref:hypothetical protein n=1 Tax=Mixta gaviniae TaxID=665914 RepID=UPI00100830FB|nr:hypothetical protein [Mixta gaviniae]